MTISNKPKDLRLWSDQELKQQAQRAIDEFVKRRIGEPATKYREHVKSRTEDLARLIRVLSAIDASNPDPDIIRSVLFDNAMFNSLRYVAGPPISADDLGVLVTKSTERLKRGNLKKDDALVIRVLDLLCQLTDSSRFPWVSDRRKARPHEVKLALRLTAYLHAAQTLQTERRAYGRVVEKLLESRLKDIGYEKQKAPNGGRVDAPMHFPRPRAFYGECSLYQRRADSLIGLNDGRVVAIESKDSGSALNSVKRVLNDTAAKAKHWREKCGENVISVALLSGVFAVPNLKAAQESGLYLVWAHDLESLTSWLDSLG